MRIEASRLFLKILLPLICLVVLINLVASVFPVFYPRRLFVEVCVLCSILPAIILYRMRHEIIAMYATLTTITLALAYGVVMNGGVLAPAYVALLIMIIFVHIILPWWGTLLYYLFMMSIGWVTLPYTPHIETLDHMPPAVYYWTMYSTYGALVVCAQVVVTYLFTRLLEQNIRREDQLISAVNAISDPLIIVDRRGELTRLNHRGERFRDALESAFETPLFEIPLETIEETSGVITLSELHQRALERDDFEAQKFTHEVRASLKEGYRYYHLSFSVYPDGSGLVIHARDTTAQHRLIEAQKMNAVGKLAGGIAHEFNNMLGAITGSVELLKLEDELQGDQLLSGRSHEDLRDDPEDLSERLSERDELIEIIEMSVDRISRITKQLLMFTQRRPQFLKTIDLNHLIESAVTLLEGTINKKVSVVIVKGTTQSHILGDERLLLSALMNLAINASQAMPAGGVIIIKTSDLADELRDDASLWSGALSPNTSHVSVEVIDNGVGISAQVLNHIFEPFFTTQSARDGVGLTAVYGAVTKHRGAIRALSKEGEGSTFQLVFPLVEPGRHEVDEEREVIAEQLTLGLRVLLVDDEESIRKMMTKLLHASACDVVTASDGVEAVKIFQDERFDLVILDMMMPVMDGISALRLMREHNHDIPVIVHSGYASDEQLEELSKLGVTRVLAKPTSRAELIKAINASHRQR